MMNKIKSLGLSAVFAVTGCAPALQSTVDINTASVKLQLSKKTTMVTNCFAKETSVYIGEERVSQKSFGEASESGKKYQAYACEQLEAAKAKKAAAKLAIK